MIIRKRLVWVLSFFCILLAGCVLKDVEKHGDLCPPVIVDDVRQQPYVPILNIHCFEEDIVVPAEFADDSIKSCDHCTLDENGAYVCDKEVDMQCLRDDSVMSRAYALCDDYRENGVLDRSGTGVIAFVKDLFGRDVDLNAPGGFELNQYCPWDYSQCYYDDEYRNSSGKKIGGYGCMEKCKEPMIYCRIDGKLSCIDPDSDVRVCGAKGACNDSNKNSDNWSGERCDSRAYCQSGKCICPPELTGCTVDSGVICVETSTNEKYCGSQCISCEDNEYCEGGVCKSDICQHVDHPVCSKNNCENSDEQCGKSCSNCTAITGVENAECLKEIGQCTISLCELDYHMKQTDDGLICEENKVYLCGPRDHEDIHDCSTEIGTGAKCSHEGICEKDTNTTGEDPVIPGEDPTPGPAETKCEEACPQNATCNEGKCQCDSGYFECDNVCMNEFITNDHCGSCDNNCNTKEKSEGVQSYSCKENKCVATCSEGYDPDSTGEGCTPAQPKKCEEGGDICPAGMICSAYTCVCQSGFDKCDGSTCVPLNTNDHCGSCENVCGGDKQCLGGVCKCTDGLTECDGSCVSLTTELNCGACGNRCGAGQCVCSGSSCSCVNASACTSDQLKCGGVCVGPDIQGVVVTGSGIAVYSDLGYSKYSSYGIGNKVHIYGYANSSYYLIEKEGVRYITTDTSKVLPCLMEGKVKGGQLKCRKQPKTGDNVREFLSDGSWLCISGSENSDWYKVACNGVGYVMKDYVDVTVTRVISNCE